MVANGDSRDAIEWPIGCSLTDRAGADEGLCLVSEWAYHVFHFYTQLYPRFGFVNQTQLRIRAKVLIGIFTLFQGFVYLKPILFDLDIEMIHGVVIDKASGLILQGTDFDCYL